MALLNRLSRRRDFTLPAFEPTPLEFEPEGDELLLEAIVAGIGQDSPVVRLVQPVPTAGELHISVERHLRGDRGGAPTTDAADELRSALAELRQSLA